MRYLRRVTVAERALAGRAGGPRGDPIERARVLLEGRAPREASAPWWDEALALVGATVRVPARPDTSGAIAKLARVHGARFGITTPLDVVRAALRHLDDWAGLDDADRDAAIEDEIEDRILCQSAAVVAAVGAHGLPVAASDLHPPLTWGIGWTDEILAALADAGALERTGERRREGWAIYAAAPPAETELRAPPADPSSADAP